jgi:hypothetical protein
VEIPINVFFPIETFFLLSSLRVYFEFFASFDAFDVFVSPCVERTLSNEKFLRLNRFAVTRIAFPADLWMTIFYNGSI